MIEMSRAEPDQFDPEISDCRAIEPYDLSLVDEIDYPAGDLAPRNCR